MPVFQQNPFYNSNLATAAAIESGFSNLAKAMFPVQDPLNAARAGQIRASTQLDEARLADILAKQKIQDDMVKQANANRRTGIAALFQGAADLDPDLAGALAYNMSTGKNIFPDMPQLYGDKNDMVQATRTAIGADFLNEPTKLSATGGESGNKVIQSIADAFKMRVGKMALDGKLTPKQLQDYGFFDSKGQRYAAGKDGAIIDQLASPAQAYVSTDGSNEYNNRENKKAIATVFATNALGNQRNTAAGLNRANTGKVNAQTNNLLNNGAQEKVVVADANSPTGYSYALPEGGMRVGAVLTGKGTKNQTGGEGTYFNIKHPLDIDTATNMMLGLDKGSDAISLATRAKIRNRVAELSSASDSGNKVPENFIAQAISEAYQANPDEFTDKKWFGANSDRYKQAGIAELMSKKPPLTPQRNKPTAKPSVGKDYKSMSNEELMRELAK